MHAQHVLICRFCRPRSVLLRSTSPLATSHPRRTQGLRLATTTARPRLVARSSSRNGDSLLPPPPVNPEPESQIEEPDLRSPLERFRTAPKKPLSVTDLVSPAWCEVQYLYTLTKFGRKRRTPAMKQGSKVHKVLEEQVHQVVPIEAKTREDGWALRIWNTIQGLRTLRYTGMTRELEIWGVLEGQVVNGIIDELSFSCPDPELEASILAKKGGAQQDVPPNQRPITDFIGNGDGSSQPSAWLGNLHPPRKVYLMDVKTRASKFLPTGASLRPTHMQLMLYRRLLHSLASSSVDANVIFSRYNVNPASPFSDSFIAELGGLDFGFSGEGNDPENQIDTLAELLSHNNLTALWGLMITEFFHTMAGPDAFGDVLKVEFRQQSDGSILGSKTFPHDEDVLGNYVGDEMRWWKGERDARGVDIEEAFKCRICEFADECTWRKEKIEEATVKYRERQKSRKSSMK
ncbi:hypothetical protein K402DRAFT_142090 [Aulographum hederae CBS 113979]|uniref:Exonuclease V n=1 Tax=Aulographum hederae CBS 113979 TaxID=1176131 RepID=A0A6G1GUC2_9PEZI|nr:hypothetical protein K402DRAFT_142090 [Aulographum hederae CBS 113979]